MEVGGGIRESSLSGENGIELLPKFGVAALSPSTVFSSDVEGNDRAIDDEEEEEEEDAERALLTVSKGTAATADDTQLRKGNSPPNGSFRVAWPAWLASDMARGIALYAFGVLCSSLTALGARLMHDEGAAVHWVVMLRSLVGVAVTAGVLWHKGVANPLGYRRGVLCLRAAVGTGAIYSFFLTAAYLPLADAAVPSFISPLITTCIAAWALGERPHWGVWCAFPAGPYIPQARG